MTAEPHPGLWPATPPNTREEDENIAVPVRRRRYVDPTLHRPRTRSPCSGRRSTRKVGLRGRCGAKDLTLPHRRLRTGLTSQKCVLSLPGSVFAQKVRLRRSRIGRHCRSRGSGRNAVARCRRGEYVQIAGRARQRSARSPNMSTARDDRSRRASTTVRCICARTPHHRRGFRASTPSRSGA